MTVLICRTCPRDARDSGSFAVAVRKIYDSRPDQGSGRVLYVNCLGACESSGNSALDSVGMTRVRFSGLSPDQAGELRDIHSQYEKSDTGDPAEWSVPAHLHVAISAVAPKRRPR